MATMLTGQFSQLWTKDFSKVFYDSYARRSTEYTDFFAISQSGPEQTQYIREGSGWTLGGAQEIDEGEETPYEAYEQGPEKTVYYSQFRLGVQVSDVMLADDQRGIMNSAMQELGNAMKYTQDLKAFDVLNSGFTTSRTGLDSKALFATDHPKQGTSGTISNKGTGSLSQSTLQTALDHFEELVNEKDIPIDMTPRMLLIPPALRWKAEELLESEYDPETANNAVNTVQGKLQFKVCHHFTSDTAWFVLASPGRPTGHDLRHVWRKNVEFYSHIDFNTRTHLYAADARWLDNFWSWRGAWGSTGAG